MSSEEPTTAAAAAEPAKKEKKAPPPGLVIPPKKPKLTKAERRALQEQQRAAKATVAGKAPQVVAQQSGKPKMEAIEGKKQVGGFSSSSKAADGATTSGDKTSSNETLEGGRESNTRLAMVSHLNPYRPVQELFELGPTLRSKTGGIFSSPITTSENTNLHPAVIQLGYRYASGEIRGGNARCRHMLSCWQRLLKDFQPDDLSADLRPTVDGLLKTSFQFWTEHCRPHSVSMGNAYTMIKTATGALDRTTQWQELRAELVETMQAYTRERIDFAGQAIADLACTKLLPDQHRGTDEKSSAPSSRRKRNTKTTGPPTILVYGYSEVVSLVLRQAATQRKQFSVVCVDSRPLLEGRRMLEELHKAGVKDCTYILLNALTYILPSVTTVLVGASALMSDGAVWNRVGTANVALLASAHNIPVLVCAESYKISNRVQLEALTHNEIGAPPGNPQEDSDEDDDDDSNNKKSIKNLTPLNLLYDLTPASFASGIVTELGIVPPTSVAVLLRELNSQQQA